MCTRVLWSNNGLTVVAGRTLDWVVDMRSNLWLLPRGMQHDGLAPTSALTWTSKYGSLTTTSYDASVCDGVNEQGFGAHVLWLAEADYGQRDESRPGLAVGLLCQFFLDNFATVEEAVAYTRSTPFQILPATEPAVHRPVTLHLAIEDPSGDSAIIEYLDGQPRIYHDRTYTVMTNSPPFDQQLAHAAHFLGLGGSDPIPGATTSDARYVRAAYFLESLPKPDTEWVAVAEMLSLMRAVSQPFGVSDPAHPNIATTRFRTVTDLTNGTYFFESTLSPSIVWARLADFDFSAGAPVMKADLVAHPDLAGDLRPRFVPTQPFVTPGP